jgi:hypothetical protein
MGNVKFIYTYNIYKYIVAYLLKARTLKPAESAVTEQRIRKQACFHGNNWIQR